MFSGIQEILVLVAIILGILFLPRILNRGQEGKKAVAPKPVAVMSGKMRLAIAASVLWPLVIAAFMQPWKNDLFSFLYIGFGPVALGWIIFWVYTGFLRK
jgi:predicted Na+-dependent transporter